MTIQSTYTMKSGKGQTEAQASTSVFTRFGDWLSGASTDRSGLTEVTIRMMKEDCQFATTISEVRVPPSTPLSPEQVEDLMGEKRINHICQQTGQSPEAVETALTEVLPMLASMLRENPERLFSYQCKIN
ncbi:YidB family protein [Gluconobacter albidus]|uniref:YidB family protein n=1 Tax=Gluconobacter albidus TaxID=318683 RepID=UPI00309CBA32